MIFIVLIFFLWSICYIKVVHMALGVSNVRFNSSDFRTILQWDAVHGTNTVYYSVQYKTYGEKKWENKTDCFNTVATWCNFTLEMSQSENEFELNYARVKAVTDNVSSPWQKSKEFHPFLHTIISPPTVALTGKFNSISVNITVPQFIQQNKYTRETKKKKIRFLISLYSLSKWLMTNDTEKNVWSISNLSLGSTYCITVQMEFSYGKKTSTPSAKQCVTLEDTGIIEIILGSFAAALAIFIVVCILLIYLTLSIYVLNPKTRLPSTLTLHGSTSKPHVQREDERVFIPSTFESMGLTKYVLEAKENHKENPQHKRYVSTEPRKKDYVNCGIKEPEHSILLEKVVELRNLTYGKLASERTCTAETTTVSMSAPCTFSHVKSFTQPPEMLHYVAIADNIRYFNEETTFEQLPYANQVKVLNCYVNENHRTPLHTTCSVVSN